MLNKGAAGPLKRDAMKVMKLTCVLTVIAAVLFVIAPGSVRADDDGDAREHWGAETKIFSDSRKGPDSEMS